MVGESSSMDFKFESIPENPPTLIVEMSIPWSINDVISLVSRAYLSTLPFLPVVMSDRIPNLMPNVPPITCMVWNIQGTGNRNKIAALKEVVKTYKPSILALVETHMSGDHAENIRKIIGYDGHIGVDVIGFSGGIWVYWKTDLIKVEPVYEHTQFITLEVSRTGGVPWLFTAVNASPDPTNRRALWTELEEFARTKINHELEFSGPAHTWARGNSLETRQIARLDRALCNIEWGTIHEDASVRHLPAFQSDHCPLLIAPNGQKKSLYARIEGCQKKLAITKEKRLIALESALRKELDKAPGPDGFQAIFYQKHWPIVESSLCLMVINVLEGKGFLEGLNDTHIVLIPKVTGPELVLQFRPISLCNVAYKIVSKVLANRIKKVLPFLISETQSGFVPGRQITDNIVIFQEVIHTMRQKKGKKSYMAIKIDLEKAYERLRWAFIYDTLTDMSIPILLRDTIMECVTSPRMQVLWNGEPTEQFLPSRGVRQSDPLSSYLFVMCLEKLQQAIDVEFRAGKWQPISICRNGPTINNLFFADDMVLFGEATVEQALTIKRVLDNFCRASGFKETADLGIYLGVPTINGRITRSTYSHLEEKIKNRLSRWSTKRLSLAGRATLLQSTLSTMANYTMQAAKIPRTVCDSIDKKSRRFLWGGDELKKPVHLISWETIQRPKSSGGLGITLARQSNAAFLTKLGYRVISEHTKLWSRVLRFKYCSGRCDVDMFQPKSNMSSVWAGITSQVHTISKGTAMAIGNGRHTIFWDHSWVDDECLSDKAIAPIPTDILGATVSEMWNEANGWKWDLFANYLPQIELQKIASFLLSPDPELEDTVFWKGTTSGNFSIKSALAIIKAPDLFNEPE
ncbi:uncharacterized protein LOC141648774 [Silene latifolia]|uniref:uncharacterized protein LOC141648774 n=1 Tax=Silene latifolia TaxID=37657 RepID=UPI003D78015B